MKPRKMTGTYRTERKQLSGLLFILPGLLIMLAVIVYPLLSTLNLSFHEVGLQPGTKYVGLDNYAQVFRGSDLPIVLKITLIWTIVTVLGTLIVGFAQALLLNENFPGRNVYRVVFLIPWVMPGISAAVSWKWLYDPQFGLFNAILKSVGLHGVLWLSNYGIVLYSVLLMNIWIVAPFVMLTLQAAMQGIPEELYQAAQVDGASYWDQLRYITIPQLRTVTNITMLLVTIWTLNSFTGVFMLTRGGPGGATTILGLYIYKVAFGFFRFGRASAVAVILLLLQIIVFYVYLLASKVDTGE